MKRILLLALLLLPFVNVAQVPLMDLPKLFSIKKMTLDSASSYLIFKGWSLTKTGSVSETNLRYHVFHRKDDVSMILRWEGVYDLALKDVCYLDFIDKSGRSYTKNVLWLKAHDFKDVELSLNPPPDSDGDIVHFTKYIKESADNQEYQVVVVKITTQKDGTIKWYSYTISDEPMPTTWILKK